MPKPITTRELIKNAFRAIVKPKCAFKEISGGERINYKIVIPLTLIWGAIFIILNFAFAQNSWLFQWGHWPLTLFFQAIYGFLLWFGGSLIFFVVAKIFKRKISLQKIEIGVFYIWVVWAIMPFFDFPHLLFKIPMVSVWGRGAHLSWVFAFPVFTLLTFFFLKDVLKFKRKELILAGCFSFFLPFLGRFFIEDIPVFFNDLLRLFNKPAGFANCALIISICFLIFSVFFRRFLLEEISFKKFILSTSIFLLTAVFIWVGVMYFTPWLKYPTGGKTLSFTKEHITKDTKMGKSVWTSSYTWTSSDRESGTIQHPASGAGNDDNDSYWSDTYASGSFDFTPSNVTVIELRVKVHFTSATANKQSGAGPKVQGCWQVGTSSTYYCSNWIENLNGASTQTFTISSSSIRTYDASGDGAAAGSTEWNSLVSNLQSGGENIIVHSWTQGDGNNQNENGDKVAFDEVYAEVYYTGGDFTQHTYRWYANADAVQPTDPWPSGGTDLSENTPITVSDNPPGEGDVLRLRMNVKGAMTINTQAFKLQYGEGSNCSSISTWYDVGSASSSAIWRGYNNPTPSDGATITSTLLSNSTKTGTHEEENNSANNPTTATMSDYTEYDWVIQHNGASENTTYCFRMVESGGTALDTYTNYPKLTTKPAIINQRAYIFENDDGANVNSNSDIASANTALTNVFRGMRFVARFQIDETNNVSTGNKTYKLQYDKDGDGNWTDVRMAGAPSSNSGSGYGDWNLKTVYSSGSVGNYSSIAIGNDGLPVISFYDATNANLMVCKCIDTSCVKTPTCTTLDSTGDVGRYTSIAISNDGGKPVIAYRDVTNSKLKLCKCGNSSCSSGNTCTTVKDQTGTDVGCGDNRLSMAIGTDGNPFIAFNNGSNQLRVCKCANDSCSGNSTCTTVYSTDNVARWSSVAIGNDGYPVISFDDWLNLNLMFVHCTNASCSSFDAPVTIEGTADNSGIGSSIAIGVDGNPVISHFTDTGSNWGNELRVCKCGNSNCTSGNTCNSIYTQAQIGNYSTPATSLAIGRDGFPVIVHSSYGSVHLRYVKCNDAACSGGWRNEYIMSPDSGTSSDTSVYRYAAVVIGADGYPVVSYYDKANDDLKVAKMMPLSEIRATWGLSGSNGDNLTSAAAGTCYGSKTFQDGKWHEATGTSVSYSLDANKCTELAFMIDTSEATVGVQYRLRLVKSDGTALDSYSQYPTFTIVSETNNTKRYSKESILTALGSGSETCGSGIYNYNCTTVYSGSATDYYGNVIAIGTDGLPIIAFADGTNLDLRVCKCGNASCSSGNTCTTIESTGVGITPSIAIGTDGLPIIAHHNTGPNYDLRVCKCGNASCSSGNTCTTVDSTNAVGLYTSIAIGTDGLPIIAHHDGTNYDLRVCKCGNASCSSGNTCTTVESTNSVGWTPSIAIGTDGLPIIAHRDATNYDLRICKCGNASCSSGNSCVAVDSNGNVGVVPSLAIGADGLPVIIHGDGTNLGLRVCKCGNASCSSGNTCTTVESTGVVSGYISLAIGVDGLPVASYNDTSKNLKVIKGLGLPTTATAFFNNFIKTDRQIKYNSETSSSQFLEHWGMVEDGLMYWFDKKGYDNVYGHDGNRDQITSSANESPVYEFIDKHSSASNNIYVQWTGRSNVAASSKNIKLEIYNWNTNSWETVTTESSCAANTDCVISGSKTSNLSYYYFPRYIYDSTKAGNNTSVEYYTYWRVYQETASGSQTLQTDNWSIGSVEFIYLSGNAYNNETSTALTECDDSAGMISLRVDSTTYGPIYCGDSNGSFILAGIPAPSANTPMILWIDGQSSKASTVNKYDGSGDITGIELRKDRLVIMSESGNITNSDLDTYDSGNDSDIIYLVSSNNLTLADGYKLIVKSGTTYQPQGTVTTSPSSDPNTTDGDILIQSTATMNMETNSFSCGGDWTATGTFTKSSGQTITFTAIANSHQIVSGSSHFDNVTFNGSGGGWSPSTNKVYVDGDLTMTAGTFDTSNGTADVEVLGNVQGTSGVINMTSTNTFTQKPSSDKNFGTTSGSSNWTFYNLNFDTASGSRIIYTMSGGTGNIEVKNVLTIAASTDLRASSRNWILSGTGTPFVINGTFSAESSTFNYTGNGATNVKDTTYYTLNIGTSNSANITYTAQGIVRVNNNLNLQSAASGYINTFDMGGYNLFVGSNSITNSGNISVPTRSSFNQSSDGTTTLGSSGGATPIIGGAGSTTFYRLNLGIASDNTSYTYNLGGNISILGDFTITSAGTGTHSLDVTNSNYSITLGGSWTNNGTFTCRQGTVTFNATSTGKTITDGGSPFYNMVFNGSGGGWLYQNGCSTAPNSTTVQAGTVTFLNAKTGTVSVTGGTLNVDWYLGAHVVSLANPSINIDTGDNDITISENSSTPQPTVWKMTSGSWGSPSTSQTTGTNSSGLIPNPTSDGAIRIREYSKTSSSTTYYKYNLTINWQTNYGMYDYYYDYGQNYITSTQNPESGNDKVIGVNWYRATPSNNNPEPTINEPPTYGTFYCGMIVGLSVEISDYDIEFGSLTPGGNPTDRTNTITVGTSASSGYIVYAFSTQKMTHTSYPTITIPDWNGSASNANPTTWNNGYFGFGYSTDDYSLTGGTPNRFSGPKFAPFVNQGPGDPVCDRTSPTLPSDGQNTITYRIAVSHTQPAGNYATTIVFVVVGQY